ncbi:MAG: HAD family hydrolase [Bacteroidales bacterium]|nr:HAD family hydrolase [Bacteroidales bacterium]
MIKALIFDWGDTIMRDFEEPGPVSEWKEVAWIPGAAESLQKLHQKYVCIIATSASHSDTAEMKKALKRMDADRYFQHFYSKVDLGFAKPDPRFFERILSLSKLQPEDAVMIGNLYDKDISSAKKAGLFTVFFNENGLSGDFPDADIIIRRMHELIQYF